MNQLSRLIKLDVIAPSVWDVLSEPQVLLTLLLVIVPSIAALIIIIHLIRKRKK